MESILEFITLEHRIEHDLEHKKQFSSPKIYNAKGNLNKRWYVYYSYRNPISEKLERQKNVYGITNTFPTFEERMYILSTYARNLLKLLEQGYSPYIDNTELYQNLKQEEEEENSVLSSNGIAIASLRKRKGLVATGLEQKETTENPIIHTEKSESAHCNTDATVTVEMALQQALSIKKNVVNERTHADYTYKAKHLLKWLEENEPTVVAMEQLKKQHLNTYLNDILGKTSPRNRNNYRIDLSSLFQTLKDNDLIADNYMKKIPPLRSVPVRNRGFSLMEQEKIFLYLEKRDPLLLLYIKFISYAFLRPIEACRIKIEDVDVTNKRIRFKAKNKPYKTKILPQLLIDALPDLSGLPKENLLFSPKGIGLHWESKLSNRRDYFSKRFKDVIKDHFGFNENYGLYSFRHTYITKLYN